MRYRAAITLPGDASSPIGADIQEWRSVSAAANEEPPHVDSTQEPPVSPTIIGGDYSRKAPPLDQRRVVIRLRDGETILVGGSPSYEDALVLAQKTILELGDVSEGEWPLLGDRFINPDAIVSVDVLKWN